MDRTTSTKSRLGETTELAEADVELREAVFLSREVDNGDECADAGVVASTCLCATWWCFFFLAGVDRIFDDLEKKQHLQEAIIFAFFKIKTLAAVSVSFDESSLKTVKSNNGESYKAS